MSSRNSTRTGRDRSTSGETGDLYFLRQKCLDKKRSIVDTSNDTRQLAPTCHREWQRSLYFWTNRYAIATPISRVTTRSYDGTIFAGRSSKFTRRNSRAVIGLCDVGKELKSSRIIIAPNTGIHSTCKHTRRATTQSRSTAADYFRVWQNPSFRTLGIISRRWPAEIVALLQSLATIIFWRTTQELTLEISIVFRTSLKLIPQ